MKNTRDIVFITFDIPRSDYPSMSYSIASILATLRINEVNCTHYPIDIKQALQDGVSNEHLAQIVKGKVLPVLKYFMSFRYIAISLTRWSTQISKQVIGLFSDYEGKIILGGYEVTASDAQKLITEFPTVSYFIKGYAERSLLKLLKNQYPITQKIIQETISEVDMASPYLTGIIDTFSRKLYWETKRGCRFSCGFCEWGNAEKILFEFNHDRLKQEIDLISSSCVEELNILDATFNFGRKYIGILRYILENTKLKVTFQARFEMLFGRKATEFLDLVVLYSDRIHMEFGLQTIDENEMEVIGRKNKMPIIGDALTLLNNRKVDYEVSIIYAIPGQTIETFIDTIEYLRINNCSKICAYPLQIPRNSKLEKERLKYCIVESTDKYDVSSVRSSISFSKENRSDMDAIAARSNDERMVLSTDVLAKLKLQKVTDYQFELQSLEGMDLNFLDELVEKYFVVPSIKDARSLDFFGSAAILGSRFEENEMRNNKKEYLAKVLTEKYFFEVEKKGSSALIIDVAGQELSIPQSNKNVKFFCKIRIGVSGAVYVYRKIVSN